MKNVFLDLETSGFSPEENQIIELSLRCDGQNFSTYLKHDKINWQKGTLEFHQENIPDILFRIERGADEEKLEKMLVLYLRSLGVNGFS